MATPEYLLFLLLRHKIKDTCIRDDEIIITVSYVRCIAPHIRYGRASPPKKNNKYKHINKNYLHYKYKKKEPKPFSKKEKIRNKYLWKVLIVKKKIQAKFIIGYLFLKSI